MKHFWLRVVLLSVLAITLFSFVAAPSAQAAPTQHTQATSAKAKFDFLQRVVYWLVVCGLGAGFDNFKSQEKVPLMDGLKNCLPLLACKAASLGAGEVIGQDPTGDDNCKDFAKGFFASAKKDKLAETSDASNVSSQQLFTFPTGNNRGDNGRGFPGQVSPSQVQDAYNNLSSEDKQLYQWIDATNSGDLNKFIESNVSDPSQRTTGKTSLALASSNTGIDSDTGYFDDQNG